VCCSSNSKCVAVCCNLLQRIVIECFDDELECVVVVNRSVLQLVAACCSMLLFDVSMMKSSVLQ